MEGFPTVALESAISLYFIFFLKKEEQTIQTNS